MANKGIYSISVADGSIKNAHDGANTDRAYQRVKDHDERVVIPSNADERLTERNITLVKTEGSYQDRFNELFWPARQKYNEKQKRKDRKKDYDYWSGIVSGEECKGRISVERGPDGNPILDHNGNQKTRDGREKTVYEMVIQIGDRQSNGITTADFPEREWRKLKKLGRQKEADALVDKYLNTSPEREELKRILTEEVSRLPEKYPELAFVTISGHDDEVCGTYHCHVAYIPSAHYDNGVECRDSLSRCLSQMGFGSNEAKKEYAITAFEEKIKNDIESAMVAHGYSRDIKGSTRSREDVHGYIARQELEEEIAELREERDDLQAENEKLSSQTEDLQLEIVELKSRKTEVSSKGLTIEEIDRRELELEEQAKEQDEIAAKLAEAQTALTAQDEAYRKSIADHDARANAYKNRYGQLFAGVQGLIRKLPEQFRIMFSNLVDGLQAMDKLDRYGLNRYEREIAVSDKACSDAQRRLDVAVADMKARIRGRRNREAETASKDVSDVHETDREMEF